jgi:acyl carrier protein
MSNDIQVQVRKLVGDLVPAGGRQVETEDRIVEDLGYDSVSIVELALALEVEFDLSDIPEEQAMDLVTVGDIEGLVSRLILPGK